MDEALATDAPAPAGAGLPAALGGRRRGLRRRGGAPAPDPARRRRRARGLPRPALRAHPLPALLRPVPAHLPARPGAVHHRRPPRPGGARRPARRRDHRGRPLRGHARAGRRREVVGPAEVAFVVRDDHQGRGLGSILLEHLAAAARERGMRRFEAEVLAENNQMVRVFRDAGYQVSREFADGVLHLEFDIDPTERSMEVRDSREQRAEARSVHNVLHPRSVAVIGASTDPGKIGHAVLLQPAARRLRRPGLPGQPRGPVGARGARLPGGHRHPGRRRPRRGRRAGRPAWARCMDSCLAKGVKALVVVSAGFADAGAGRRERRSAGSPTRPGRTACGWSGRTRSASRTPTRRCGSTPPSPRRCPAAGRVGFFSQSGALGVTLLAAAAERGLGLSTFVSAGNRADVSGNDLLQYWQTDPATDVVLLYLETFGNPRKFARLARRLARTKPIVAVKSGRWTGRRRPRALAATGSPMDERGVQALFEQSGVIRVENVTQMFDTALLLAHQPLPAGGRVAVVGNSTALNLLVVDALHGEGLELAGRAGRRRHHGRARQTSPPPSGKPARSRRGRRARGRVRPAARHAGRRARRARCARRSPGWTSRWSAPSSPPRACPPSSRSRARRRPGPRIGAQLPDARARRRRARAGPCGTRGGVRRRSASMSGRPGSTLQGARALVERLAGRAATRDAGDAARRRRARRAAALLRHRDAAVPARAERRRDRRRGERARVPGGGQGDRRAVAAPRRRRRACG